MIRVKNHNAVFQACDYFCLNYVSVNSNWVHPPLQSRGLAKKTCPGDRDLTFESCPGAENSTRAGILWKMKLKLQKIEWIKFLQVKTKRKQVEFLPFSRFRERSLIIPGRGPEGKFMGYETKT